MKMFQQTILFHLSICIVSISIVNPALIPKTDWFADAQKELQNALRVQQNTNVAKNVILFIGDGMGVSTVTAARILRGQLKGETGEDTVLEFEKFPHVGMAKTYSNDKQTPDSGATATALLCGEKTNSYTIGVNDNVKVGNCSDQVGNELDCITDWFRDAGRSSGVVTTTRITHATPAASYAKIPHRNWESDYFMNNAGVPLEGCNKDIAHQLVFNSNLKVILGGGRMFLLDNNTLDPQYGNLTTTYQRQDGMNLIEEWKKKNGPNRSAYVWNKGEFDKVNPQKTDRLLGLFDASHMQYELDRNADPAGEPSLAEMTGKAIKILQKDPKGFFLLVEGGRIDHGHHANNAARSLHDVLAFEDAVKKAVQLTNEKDTLLIVTADHSHLFNIAGYPSRGNDILGLSEHFVATDDVPYTTLSYGNGPGYRTGPRTFDNVENSTSIDYRQEAAVPLNIATHAGEDVSIYARGPMSHLIHGIHEQNYVAHVMAYAACVGNTKCDRPGGERQQVTRKKIAFMSYFEELTRQSNSLERNKSGYKRTVN